MPVAKLPRLSVSYRERPAQGPVTRRLLLVHGNVSTGVFFEPLMEALPASWHLVAPDLRGFGETDSAPIDATRGLRDWSDDLFELLQALGWTEGVHALGWSVGGGVVMQLAIDHPGLLASTTLVNPVPPRGFGGLHGADGVPNESDFAGSGAGAVSGDFINALRTHDRGTAQNSARGTMRSFFFNAEKYQPPKELEDAWVDAINSTRIGDGFYPGNSVPSSNWPGSAPGTRGINNAFSPRYQDLTPFAALSPAPRVFWARGDKDLIVSDASFFDLAQLGKLGYVPGWPGEARCPPQPMVSQTAALLERFEKNGGQVKRHVFEGTGHSPFLEAQADFVRELVAFVG
jgi:pimeloyl-ACP methyl ester carboxylesterase